MRPLPFGSATGLLLFLLALAAPAQTPLRYQLHSFPAATRTWETPDRTIPPVVTTNTILFKLDTERGLVWRFESNRFVRIEGPDLGSNTDIREWKTRRFLGLLDGIIIPELAFRETPLTNVLSLLEQEVRQREPAFRMYPKPFLVLTNSSGEGIPDITFTATGISARQALKIVASVCGMHMEARRDILVIRPVSIHEGQVEYALFDIRPGFATTLANENVTNVLLNLGMEPLPAGCRVSYEPKLEKLVVGHTFRGLREIKELLYRNDLLPPEPGRFTLLSVTGPEGPAVWLNDQKTGDTWRYAREASPLLWEEFQAIINE